MRAEVLFPPALAGLSERAEFGHLPNSALFFFLSGKLFSRFELFAPFASRQPVESPFPLSDNVSRNGLSRYAFCGHKLPCGPFPKRAFRPFRCAAFCGRKLSCGPVPKRAFPVCYFRTFSPTCFWRTFRDMLQNENRGVRDTHTVPYLHMCQYETCCMCAHMIQPHPGAVSYAHTRTFSPLSHNDQWPIAWALSHIDTWAEMGRL